MPEICTQFDHEMMSLALNLAQKGAITTRPNPCVGCVITRDQKIIGRGWHQKAGGPHAEIHALEEAGENASGATAYVTLEPCSHFGKTPPCCDALINAGISKAIIAMQDPNPNVSGAGIEALSNAGIKVHCGLMEQAARKLNRGFIKRMTQGEPLVRCKMAMSLDGRTAMASGESQWITSSPARADGHRLRARSGAIITGIGTVLADRPQMTVRDDKFLACGVPQPLRVILDSGLRIPIDSPILSSAPNALVVCASPDTPKQNSLEEMGIQVLSFPNSEGQIDLKNMLQYLATTYEINDVLVEAGATLSGAFLEQQLADELIIYVAPDLLGNNARGLVNLPGLTRLSQKVSLEIEDIRPIGRDWRIMAHCKNESP